MKTASLALLLAVITPAVGESPLYWDYNKEGSRGPEHWNKLYGGCVGQRQSPIDIRDEDLVVQRLPSLRLNQFDKKPDRMTVLNTGHSLQVSLNSDMSLSGGGLGANYKITQFHFHWGSNSSKGSEHLRNGQAYVMEMHIVSFNVKYPNFIYAKIRPHGVAVLGFFFRMGPSSTQTQLLDRVLNKTGGGDAESFPLSQLLSEVDIDKYYRYNGSTTVPTCEETVTWTVFQDPLTVTEAQMNTFRKLKDKAGAPLVNNFRPIQSLGERNVSASFDFASFDVSAADRVRSRLMLAAATFMLLLLLLLQD